MSRLRELVGRARSEDDGVLEAAHPDGDWDAAADDWDWDAEWAAQDGAEEVERPSNGIPTPRRARATLGRGQAVDPTSRPDHVEVAGDADREPRRVRTALGRREQVDAGDHTPETPARSRRLPCPPVRRRAPLLLVAAVAGAVAASLLGTVGTVGTDATPLASGLDYGLGVSDASFSGGVDVAGARGEISQAEAQARLSEIAASRAAREPDFVVPTDGRLTTCFCQRWGTMHWGIDLAAPLGTPIFAAADGVVLRAGPASGYGNAVYVQDADGNVQIYGHMKYYSVEAGDVVSAGDQIAKVGNQGQSTGPHLHFEIHSGGMNGKPIDPEEWLGERGLAVG